MPRTKIMIVGIAVFCLFLSVFAFSCLLIKYRAPINQDHVIRVRLFNDLRAAKIGPAGINCRITDKNTGKIIEESFRILKGAEVKSSGSKILFGKALFETNGITVTPLEEKILSLNGKFYRGELIFITSDKGIDVINKLGLEDYIRGVVPREMNQFWPLNALRAQAIVSRTFAVYKSSKRKNKEYDLTADTYAQVYGGKSYERLRTNIAVENTKDEVLEYNGKIFPAYFHSCCGGSTQDAYNMWGKIFSQNDFNGKDGPLKGVKCHFCSISPHFRWQVRLQPDIIIKRLNGRGYGIREIRDIKEGAVNDTGRLEYVSVETENGWFEINAEDFCYIIGANILRSSNFNIKKYPLFYLFSGYGWGHGVGMCQWGALGMAVRLWSADRILNYYYPGTKITMLKELYPNGESK